MEITYNNISTSENQDITLIDSNEKYTPVDLFKIFYKQQHNQDLNEEQEKIISNIFKEINMEVK